MSVAPPEEHVLVVPTSLFHSIGQFQGFCCDVDRYFKTLIESNEADYRPRSKMETDPRFKQLIPYVLFEYQDEHGQPHLFQYLRGGGQGEARLHAKRSVGVGGHISSIDQSAASAYHEGMRRELDEEVAIETEYTEECVGLINDDANEVGQVHLGVVHRLRVRQPNIQPREAELLDAAFRPVSELLKQLDEFETWSQICLQSLYADFASTP